MSPINVSVTDLNRVQFQAMETGDLELARRCLHAEFVNHEAQDEPAATRLPGPAGFLATSAWLRLAFTDLHFEVHEVISDGDRAIAHVTMSGRQTGPFVVFPDGQEPVAFPPTGAPFAVRQCHLFTIKDGLIADHAAVRDDLGMMTQLGHLPPGPRAAARMMGWHLGGGARRAVRQATQVAQDAADAANTAMHATCTP